MDLCEHCQSGEGIYDMDRLCCVSRYLASMPFSYRRARAESMAKRLRVNITDVEDATRYFLREGRKGKVEGR